MEGSEGAWDDVHRGGRGELPSELLKQSRKEEIDFIEGKPVWDLRKAQECWAVRGKAAIQMKW
eukprot:10393480-Karenia_brevis.AAC.1